MLKQMNIKDIQKEVFHLNKKKTWLWVEKNCVSISQIWSQLFCFLFFRCIYRYINIFFKPLIHRNRKARRKKTNKTSKQRNPTSRAWKKYWIKFITYCKRNLKYFTVYLLYILLSFFKWQNRLHCCLLANKKKKVKSTVCEAAIL